MIQWLQGKKTYIGAGAIAIAAIVFFFLHQISAPTLSMALGAAVAISGLSAKLNRYLPDIVEALEDVQQKKYQAAAGVVEKDASDAAFGAKS
jgi:hypothetical protein